MARTIIPDEFDNAKWGDTDHLEVAQQKTFTEMVFELLSEREPGPSELEIFNLILNLCLDHGPETPSAIPTIEAAREGKSMSESITAGILQIGDRHGGAAEPLMKELYRVKDSKSQGVKELVEEYGEKDKKMPGFGHRIYKDKDPRAQLILERVRNLKNGENWVKLLEEIKSALKEKTGKDLPINIDGAIAAALCAMNFQPEVGKAIFIIARTPGLIGQYLNNSEAKF